MIQQELPEINVTISASECGGCDCTLSIKKIKKNLFSIDVSWCVTAPGKYRFFTTIKTHFKQPELFVPSVLYKKNDCGTGSFPRGGIESNLSFEENRTPLSGCVILNEGENYFGCCLSPCKNILFTASCGAFTKDGNVVIQMEIPCVERPFSYQGKTKTVSEKCQKKELEIAQCTKENPVLVERTQYLYVSESKKADKNMMFFFYKSFSLAVEKHFLPSEADCDISFDKNSQTDWDEWFKLKLHHLLFLTYQNSADKTACILMGKGNGENQEVYYFTGASFLVKSIEGAVIFAESGNEVLAEEIGKFFLQAESEKNSGVYRDNYSFSRKIWGGYLGVSENSEYAELVNARCNGEAMISYIKLYEALLAKGRKFDEFITLPERVIRFYIKNQFHDKNEKYYGSFGRWWTPEGRAVNANGTNGAYIVSLMTSFYKYAGKKLKKEIEKSLESAAYYYHNMIENADYYGDTLDADAYDKESAAVLLRESLDMFDFTGKKQYLEDAEKAASFVYTWMWQYNILFPENTPLARERFRTCGMTSVSVAHHHLDFYGMYLARDFLRLCKASGNKFYLKAACKLIRACGQLVARKENLLGKDASFEGWQPEQINHTQWDYFDRSDRMKGFYDICIAWEPVLTLGAYLQIKKECPEAFVLTQTYGL